MTDLYAQMQEDALRFAREDLLERETQGKNRSPFIDAINKEVGLPLGSPYCKAALWVRVFKRVCDKHNLKNPIPRNGSSQSMLWEAPHELLIAPGNVPKVGYVGIMTMRKDRAHGHIYLLTEVVNEMKHKTIEYNTNGAGSRDGDGCHELERTVNGSPSKKLSAYVDWIGWVIARN